MGPYVKLGSAAQQAFLTKAWKTHRAAIVPPPCWALRVTGTLTRTWETLRSAQSSELGSLHHSAGSHESSISLAGSHEPSLSLTAVCACRCDSTNLSRPLLPRLCP
ncbi:unnamed protein product [Rangifer tarandus platyrhynchus]|uniref:Uncharacterized protein n=1 Tax=Rangifer tarandus platyrhynchus TaxID=3082113 RepID=A0AC59ZM17_RANTA